MRKPVSRFSGYLFDHSGQSQVAVITSIPSIPTADMLRTDCSCKHGRTLCHPSNQPEHEKL